MLVVILACEIEFLTANCFIVAMLPYSFALLPLRDVAFQELIEALLTGGDEVEGQRKGCQTLVGGLFKRNLSLEGAP
jgi:hypothetical protein